jgi:hypothetical protein
MLRRSSSIGPKPAVRRSCSSRSGSMSRTVIACGSPTRRPLPQSASSEIPLRRPGSPESRLNRGQLPTSVAVPSGVDSAKRHGRAQAQPQPQSARDRRVRCDSRRPHRLGVQTVERDLPTVKIQTTDDGHQQPPSEDDSDPRIVHQPPDLLPSTCHLLHRRDDHLTPLPRALLHRTRKPPRPPRRLHHQPDRRLRHPAGAQPPASPASSTGHAS